MKMKLANKKGKKRRKAQQKKIQKIPFPTKVGEISTKKIFGMIRKDTNLEIERMKHPDEQNHLSGN